MLSMILSWFGGGVLKSILGEIDSLTKAKLASTNELEKARIQERMDALHVQADQERARLADVDNARRAAAGLPRWMAIIGFMIGFPFALHICFVGFGTIFAPLVSGGWLDWTLHIPKWPAPLDQSELGIIIFFFGSATVIGATGKIANAIMVKRATK